MEKVSSISYMVIAPRKSPKEMCICSRVSCIQASGQTKKREFFEHLNEQVDGGDIWLDIVLQHLVQHLQGEWDLWTRKEDEGKQKQKQKHLEQSD